MRREKSDQAGDATIVFTRMFELNSQLTQLRDFYYEAALKQKSEKDFVFAPRLIDTPAFFTLDHLQRHLNNPLLMPGWFSLFWQGKSVDCAPAVGNKVVQNATLSILNKSFIQDYLAHGAALVLEAIECLEPDINAMCAAIDAAHNHVLSNAVVFFSQQGGEAYRGHFDTDDALVIQLAGQKKWRLYERVPPRQVEQGNLSAQQLGPVRTELVLNPGDALFVRSCTPHLVQTTGPYSLHMTFDICDHNVPADDALNLAMQAFQQDAAGSYTVPEGVIDKLIAHMQAPGYRQRINELQTARARHQTHARDVGLEPCHAFRTLACARRGA